MRKKATRTNRNVLLILLLAISIIPLACVRCSAQSLAIVKETSPLREETPHFSPVEDELTKPTSPYWRAFLWEAIPSEWLSSSSKRAVLESYQQNNWKPIFIDSRFEITRGAKLFVERLAKLEEDAIDPRPYRIEVLQKNLSRLDHAKLALKSVAPRIHDTHADFSEISSFESPDTPKVNPAPVKYAMGDSAGPPPDPTARKDREERYRDAFRTACEADIKIAGCLIRYAQEMHPSSEELQLKVLTGAISMDEFLKAISPTSQRYNALVKAYATYRQLAARGQQQRVGGGATIRPGETGNRIRELQKRLEQEGFYTGKITGHFDPETVGAVKRFQSAHNMQPDGSVGQQTIDWLNVSFEQKAKMVAQSMKTVRLSQTRLHDRFVRINIPQFILEYWKDGKISQIHRVIVGKAGGKKVKLMGRIQGENESPTLSSSIEQVIVNPRWYVTERILRELADDFASDPSYFSRHGYVRTSSQRVFQQPGPNNALGRVKFEFPNAYAVFLHDTNKRQLFQRSKRDLSHGCIRVDKAQELAEIIVSDDRNPAAEKIASSLGHTRPTYIKLNEPLPIVIEYATVTTSEQGQVVFCRDLYNALEEEAPKTAG